MTWKERKLWIRRIWIHYQQCRIDGSRFVRTYFWPCFKGTLALLFNREVEYKWDEGRSRFEIAWSTVSRSMCDFGEDESWETLEVRPWLRFCTYWDSKF